MSSNNKYGLDFRVWGYKETKRKDTTPDILKDIGHGWGESSRPKKQLEEVDCTIERIEPKKELITCKLKNARFLPDENTDFNKPCKIRVEIEGKSNRIVHFYLWAVYEGVEYDLQYEIKADKKNGICETEMKLFYVDQFYIDYFNNEKKDAKVEYFAKIKMQGAKEIKSEVLVMPRPPAVLNINEIDGPDSLAHNTKGVYVVKSFNREASQEEKDSLSWAVKINGKEIERFENIGDSFEYTPCAKYAGETITVHPFLRSPSDKLFIKTTVGQYLLYNGSELIWLDESHKEVGKWKACSSSDNADPAKENGPLPEGNWVVLQDARDQNMENSWWKELTGKKDPVIWADKNRVELVPFKETDTHGRVEKFYVFCGEDSNSSLRGINLAGDIVDFVDKFQKSGKNLVLLVNYSEVLVMPRELPSLNNKELHEAPMQTSEYGKQFIMKHEGFMAKPYNCSAGHATIGYGTLLHKGPVNEEDINKYGTGITKETAKAMFDKSIIKFEIALNKAVKVKLNQNQFDALMSWTYNFGEAQLNEKYTKWLRELNKGNYNIVPSEIQRWNKITKNGIKIESAGLTKRRKEESELFKENIW